MACLPPIGQPPNRTSTRPHSIKKKSLARPASLPDLTRAKAGRPPTRTHANSHFMATPGHQSLLLPCIPGMPYRRHRTRGPLPSPRATIQDELFSALANGDAHWGSPHGPGPWTADRGSWHIARCAAVTQPPASTTPCALCLSPPLSHQIPKVESTASHDHLNVSIRPEFRAEEAAVEHWYRAYWKAKRQTALGGHAQSPKSVLTVCLFIRVPYSTHIVTGQPVCMCVCGVEKTVDEREKRASAPTRRPRGPMSLLCGHAVAANDVRPLAGVCR